MIRSLARATTLAALLVAASATTSLAQDKADAPVDPTRGERRVVELWEGVPAGSENWTQKEYHLQRSPTSDVAVHNVVRPTLTVYPADPSKANGTGVIVCPGGGFRMLAWTHEGAQVAEWLNERGVTAFVLKYRLVDTTPAADGKPAPAASDETRAAVAKLAGEDGRQAVRIVRDRAAEWKLDPQKLGVIGFSAGASVTMSVVLENDERSRPNFAAPIYGGWNEDFTAPANAAPLFVACTTDDKAVARSLKIYQAWLAAGKPIEMHLYAKGGHGFGMRKRGLPVDGWTDRLEEWMTAEGFLPKETAAK